MIEELFSAARRMLGATAGVAGRSGYVPSPAAGQHAAFLRGDATWVAVTGGMTYKGAVAAAALPASSAVAGDFYQITAAGTIYTILFAAGDQAIWNGATWDKYTPPSRLVVLPLVEPPEGVTAAAPLTFGWDEVNAELSLKRTGTGTAGWQSLIKLGT